MSDVWEYFVYRIETNSSQGLQCQINETETDACNRWKEGVSSAEQKPYVIDWCHNFIYNSHDY